VAGRWINMKRFLSVVLLFLVLTPGSFIVPSLFVSGVYKVVSTRGSFHCPKVRPPMLSWKKANNFNLSIFWNPSKNPVLKRMCTVPGRAVLAWTQKEIKKSIEDSRNNYKVQKRRARLLLTKAKKKLFGGKSRI